VKRGLGLRREHRCASNWKVMTAFGLKRKEVTGRLSGAGNYNDGVGEACSKNTSRVLLEATEIC
jgi:hypothetical protein